LGTRRFSQLARDTFAAMIDAVVFDLDGVLVQSEEVWDGARREVVAEAGLRWPPGATGAMMGMSSAEWSRYLHDEIGVPAAPEEAGADVLRRVQAVYRRGVPWIHGAREQAGPRRLPRGDRRGQAGTSS
jgi:beta-phosphoglucomutase-like phosphatase (HAD superfamily)